jgi:hypothetical protein
MKLLKIKLKNLEKRNVKRHKSGDMLYLQGWKMPKWWMRIHKIFNSRLKAHVRHQNK